MARYHAWVHADLAKSAGQVAGLPGAHAPGWAIVAVDCSFARSHRQIGFVHGFGFCPFRGRVHVPRAAGLCPEGV